MSETYYQKPLIVTTSGGKDSDVCIALAVAAGIDFEVQHNHTTADAPETVYHVRDTFRRLEAKGIKCTVNWPTYKGAPVTMWSLIPVSYTHLDVYKRQGAGRDHHRPFAL